MRVKVDVELRSWGDVSLADSSAHHHNFQNLRFQLGICEQ
jgi:hypothetical protein